MLANTADTEQLRHSFRAVLCLLDDCKCQNLAKYTQHVLQKHTRTHGFFFVCNLGYPTIQSDRFGTDVFRLKIVILGEE